MKIYKVTWQDYDKYVEASSRIDAIIRLLNNLGVDWETVPSFDEFITEEITI